MVQVSYLHHGLALEQQEYKMETSLDVEKHFRLLQTPSTPVQGNLA